MRYDILLIAVAGSGLLVACSKNEGAAGGDTTKPAAATNTSATNPSATSGTATKLGESAGMKAPESVRYDPELDLYYVSNVNGNASAHDNNGFIAVVRADSTSMVRMLAEGGIKGVKLDAPKGMALVGDTLWVADIDHVRAFNRRTGDVIADIDLSKQHATFLNDVAVGGDGSIYVTDTGIAFDDKGAVSHPGTDQIFKITGRTVTSIKPDSLNSPNGIAYDGTHARFVLAPFGGKAIAAWRPGDKAAVTIANGPGQYDGIEALADGRLLVTSWADSSLYAVLDSTLTKLASGLAGPADIGVDTKRAVVAVPRFNDNKVEYFKLPPR